MHGLVTLDEQDEVICPAVLWDDGRKERENVYLNKVVGRETFSASTANIAFAGFTAPKLLWVKEHGAENFSRMRKLCLPKDYFSYKFTGVFVTDYSDASGTLFLDVKNKKWSEEMSVLCSVRKKNFPQILPALKEIL